MIRNVVVGISGGVDSAVSALLLKNRGFNVRGVFMKNWDQIDEKGFCSGEDDWKDVQWVCQMLKIPLLEVNFVKEYWNDVFGQFLTDYQCGLTPNPDILCNRHIKFNAFYKYSINYLSADAIATGHYAQSSFGCFLENYSANQNSKLLCAADSIKDQTFFLSQVPQNALQKTMFPLGKLFKDDVKKIALESGLHRIAKKRESTGICFVGKRNFSEFISEYIDSKPGNFINIDTGQIIGTHNGIHHWTIGQRCRIANFPKPLFILKKLTEQNTILVSPGTDHLALYTNLLYTEKPYWIDQSPLKDGILQCKFRFQHTKPLVDCLICETNTKGTLLVKLNHPLRAISPGQYAVFYKDSECLGGARIFQPGPSTQYDLEEIAKDSRDYKLKQIAI